MALPQDYHDAWVLANGIRTHYWWAGTEGPALVLLHEAGPGASGKAWRYTMPALADAGFRVFAPDQLSMGRTDARVHAWPILGVQSLVDHLADFIDALCLDIVYVAGISQGAYVAAKYTLDHPERVSKTFFIGSGTIAAAMGLEQKPNPSWAAVLEYDYTIDAMRRYLLSTASDPSTVTDEEVAERHEMANLPGVRESRHEFAAAGDRMRRDPDLLRRFRIDADLPNLATPARFIWGKQDLFAPVDLGYRLEGLLPNIPFEFLDGCGHLGHEEQPKVVTALMTEFFRSDIS